MEDLVKLEKELRVLKDHLDFVCYEHPSWADTVEKARVLVDSLLRAYS
jgi:hypothetical protein